MLGIAYYIEYHMLGRRTFSYIRILAQFCQVVNDGEAFAGIYCMRSHQIGHLSVIPAFAGMTEFIGMAESVGMTEFMGVNWFDWIPVCAGMMGKLRCESMMARWIPAFAGMTGRLRRNDLPVASIFHHISVK